MFIAASFTIATIWKQPRCPLVDEWINCGMLSLMKNYSVLDRNELSSHEKT
jgi:hypothetical protein